MELLSKFKKSEQGSITIFVLSSLLVVLLTMIVIYGGMTNKLSSQAKQVSKIQEEYSGDSLSEMQEEYDKIIGDNEGNKVDKSELIALLEEMKKTAREDWTLDSWENLQNEIQKAEGVVEDTEVTQEDVKMSIEGLLDARTNLKRLDKRSLEMMIELVQNICDNKEKYQPDTIKGIDEKQERGKKIYNSVDVTQEEVDAIYKELRDAAMEARYKSDYNSIQGG